MTNIVLDVCNKLSNKALNSRSYNSFKAHGYKEVFGMVGCNDWNDFFRAKPNWATLWDPSKSTHFSDIIGLYGIDFYIWKISTRIKHCVKVKSFLQIKLYIEEIVSLLVHDSTQL